MIKVLLVDDDPLILKSLSLTLAKEPDMEIAGTAGNGWEAVEFCRESVPDMILMDIRMPEMDGIQATRIIKKKCPASRIMMLTTFQDKPDIQMALNAGAEGYVLKTDKLSDLPGKMRMLFQGTSVMDAGVLRKLTMPEAEFMGRLTPRERDILSLVTQGMSNRDIARHLYLSEGTVRNILSVVMEKACVKSRTQLITMLK